MKRQYKNILHKFLPMCILGILFLLWEAFSFGSQSILLPSVSDIIHCVANDFFNIIESLRITLFQAFLGLMVGILISIILAFIMYRFIFAYKILHPMLVASQCIPIVAIAPILAVCFGYGKIVKIILVAICCFFPITVSLINGFKATDRNAINLLKTMGASEMQIFYYSVLPLSRTHFFSGLKVSVSYAVVASLISEWMGGTSGLGVYMIQAKKSYALDKLFGAVIIVCIISCLMMYGVCFLEKSKSRAKRLICYFMIIIFFLFTSMPFMTFSAKSDNQINFSLDYTPNTNHTGIYVAEALGFFERENLKVNIIQPAEDSAALLVSTGRVQLGIDFQDHIAALYDKVPNSNVQAVAAILQHNTSGLISLKSSSINSFKALEGKTYATLDNFVEQGIIKYCMNKEHATYEKLNIVHANSTDPYTALHTGIDAIWSYDFWDNVILRLKGINNNFIYFRDVDPVFDYYTPIVVGQKEFMAKNPELTKKFLRALSNGYEYAAKNPDKSADILLKYAPELDSNIVHESQKIISSEYISDAVKWGQIDPARWKRFFKWAYDEGVTVEDLSKKEDLFTNAFM